MDTLSILFAGDFAPCRRFESLVLEKKEKIFNDALGLIGGADVSFVNLECPLTTSVDKIEKTGPALKSNPETVEAIKAFSVAGLANNHIFDYGVSGLKDTIETCSRAGMATVGAGLNIADAQRVVIHEAKGVKVAIIAIAEYEFNQSEEGGPGSAPIDLVDNYQQITAAKKLADVVIVTIHGGNEYFPYPRPGLRKMCRHFIDLGVDAVICHHPHVPGAYEVYEGKPIYYSIGNLVFDQNLPKPGWEEGYFVELKFDVLNGSFLNSTMHPFTQSVRQEGVRLMLGNEKEEFISRIEDYRGVLEDPDLYREIWDDFVEEKTRSYIIRNFNIFGFKGVGFLMRKFPFLADFLYGNGKADLDRLNLVRCQSHLELLSDSLRRKLGARYK